MKYNTQRKKLKFMDYGRNAEGLIQYAKTIENREVRNQVAQAIVEVMARVTPKSREHTDWRRRLWDHMMILSDWQLDVDWPEWAGEKPDKMHEATVDFKPRRLTYQKGRMKYRHYGQSLEAMIAKAKDMPDGPEKDELTKQLIETMRRSYATWNSASGAANVVASQLSELSDGKLEKKQANPEQKVEQKIEEQ